MLHKLTESDCLYAIEHGDFATDRREATEHVAIILTQSWCPQWMMMRSWLGALTQDAGLKLYFCEYDREPWFDKFLIFKEEQFGNRSVPYVRYYHLGRLTGESNFVSRDVFFKKLGMDGPSA